jgi:hypothetical protein
MVVHPSVETVSGRSVIDREGRTVCRVIVWKAERISKFDQKHPYDFVDDPDLN